MKAIKLIILALVLFSCDGDKAKNYIITYKVYYPNNTVTKTHICYCFDIRTYSSKGSNSIRYRVGENFGHHYTFIEDTSAPIEIVTVKENL